MILRFTASPHFDFLAQFADQIKMPVKDNLLKIPRSMGEGFVRRIVFADDFRLVMHQYALKEDFVIQRDPTLNMNDFLSIFFYNNEQSLEMKYNEDGNMPFSQGSNSAVQVTTNDFRSTIRFPANTRTQYIVIGITASRLKNLLSVKSANSTIRTITTEKASFLFFESMNAEMKLLLKNIADTTVEDALNHFYIQIKVLELLYLLFRRLSIRENKSYRNISNTDAEKLMMIRNEILNDLSSPPVLNELAKMAAMSETKLNQLFRQTFGDSIFNYFQKARMEEAAFLLKQANRSVSEAGYELGFSNLSHFSRLFKKHYGTTPKKYSVEG
ncbi:MAG TPA: AraC family transcriptional regulator [Chitinophagaceae bacterium]|nr:AraC family transcriptional regulator [Chitinophagaceae bacterium]